MRISLDLEGFLPIPLFSDVVWTGLLAVLASLLLQVPGAHSQVPATPSAPAPASTEPAPAPPPPMPVPPPADPEGWRALARDDLNDLYRALSDNHPGKYVDKDSADYRAWLERGYAEAKASLPRVTDAASYYYLMQGYIGGFRDTHLVLWPSRKEMGIPTRSWPGFTTRWLGGRYVVAPGAPAGDATPPAGAQLISCDGKPAELIAKERLDRYEGNLQLESQRFTTASRLLWERGNVFVPPPPRTCDFKVGAATRAHRLSSRPGDQEELSAAVAASRAAARGPEGVSMWNGIVPWIGLPSSFTGEEAWQALFAQIDAQKQQIQAAPLVVIDARGTVGGSSGYANQLARRLWSRELVAAHQPQLGDLVWRVSPDNRRFLVNTLEKIKKEAALSGGASEMEEMIARFDEAAQRGEHSVYIAAKKRPAAQAAVENPMQGRVIVLTDYSCVSACLDFMDLVLAMPNVEQAGMETNADTIFMEADRFPLPSGMLLLDVPHKAWVQRPRGSNVTYVPRPGLRYRGDPADDAALKQWLWTATGMGRTSRGERG